MKFKIICGLAAASLSAFGFALSAPPQADHAALPPLPEKMALELAASKIKIGAAIATAESATGGLAAAANAKSGQYTIDTYGDKGHVQVSVSMSTGEILSEKSLPWIAIGDAVITNWITTESGLMYAEIVKGSGGDTPDPSSSVSVHYTGWLLNGTKFDSSVDRGQPTTFPLARVIPGWTEGVGSMQVGGKRKLLIPASLAYGANGSSPTIPPMATLVFDVELLAIQ